MRRSLILAAILVLTAGAANAQDYIKAGQLVVGGVTALSVNRQTFSQKDVTESTTNTSTQIDLSGTYFFSKSIGLGLALIAQNTSVSVSGASDKTTVTTYAIGPLIAFRFGSGRVSFNIRGGAGVGKNSITPGGGEKTDTDVTFFEGGGGLNYHISEFASFDVGLRYQKSTIKDPTAPSGTPSTDASGFVLGAGFSLYFGGR